MSLREALPSWHNWDPRLIAAEAYLTPIADSQERPGLSVGQIWTQIIKAPLIPFDPLVRSRKLTHAYDALREYLNDLRDPKERGVNRTGRTKKLCANDPTKPGP
jgi:hypothetical protein